MRRLGQMLGSGFWSWPARRSGQPPNLAWPALLAELAEVDRNLPVDSVFNLTIEYLYQSQRHW